MQPLEKTIGEERRFRCQVRAVPEIHYERYVPPDAIIICPNCGARNTRDDKLCKRCQASLRDPRAYGRYVRQVIQRHPELRGGILTCLRLSDLPADDFYVSDVVVMNIANWAEKADVAKNLELARRFEESARQYEDLGLWADAGRVRALAIRVPTQTIREREIVLVKCRYCGSLNPQGYLKCTSCGGLP
jgi:ribosomal protein L40E